MEAVNQYFDNICRTCMDEIVETSLYADKQWHSIFDISDCEGLNIAELLSLTIPKIKVKENDELPKKICLGCLHQLKNSYSFQKMCLQANQQIHEMILYDSKFNEDGVNALPEAMQSTSVNLFKYDEEVSQSSEINCNEYVKTKSGVDSRTLSPSTLEEIECNDYVKTEPSVEAQTMPQETVEATELRDIEDIEGIHEKSESNAIEHSESIQVKNEPCMDEDFIAECRNKSIMVRIEEKHEKNALNAYTCLLCNKAFTSQKSLRYHNWYYCAKDTHKRKKPYPCKFCNKTFQFKSGLTIHLRMHTGERPYSCTQCGKSFLTSDSLKRHQLSHSEVKPFECPDCPLKFYGRDNLTKHKKVHADLKPHVCNICGKSFTTSHYLLVHKKFHSGEKNHKCDHCDMRFVRMETKRIHMRSHTGEKPYQCKYCEYAFTGSNGLLRHVRVHLGENVHRCQLCPSAFRLASELRLHFATHKNDDNAIRERHLKALKEQEIKIKKGNKGNLKKIS